MHPVRVPIERLVERLIALGDQPGAVDVDWGAYASRDSDERHSIPLHGREINGKVRHWNPFHLRRMRQATMLVA